jgi:hypothetical protein
VSKHPAFFVLLAIPLTWAQQPNGATTNPTPVTTQPSPTAAKLRIDSVRSVDPGNMYHRVYARVPLVGTGTKADPKRPMFAPTTASTDHTGILGYSMQISDDGQWALCEFVGATPNDLKVITASTASNVVFFEQGHATLEQVVADFSQYKKNFSFAPFTVRVQ